MNKEVAGSLVLDSSQQAALEALAHTILHTHNELQSLGKIQTLSTDRREEFSNVFGVVGPRGAGKSTLLTQLICERGRLLSDPKFQGFKRLRIIRPLDCSTILPGIEPGMAILIHLWAELESILDERSVNTCPRPRSEGNTVKEKLIADHKALVSTYLWSLDAYRDLELDLASSPKNFALALVEDTGCRMRLNRDLAKWLDDLLDELDDEALIVLLDDFDLVHAKRVRSWFNCLLDELHQANLFFVLTGDFHRLEHLIFDHEAEIDDKTARAQLEKLLPLHHRIDLSLWLGKARLDWPPMEKLREKKLETLIESVDSRIDRTVLRHLLPSRPRGLKNLHKSLSNVSNRILSGTGSARDLLGTLATCRGEPLLSRHLRKSGVEDWTALFLLAKSPLSLEDWREGVRAARQRAPDGLGDGVSPLPILGLELAPSRLPETQLSRKAGSSSARPLEMLQIETSAAAESQDPLRHEHLWHAPLRDVDITDQPFWTELLLDLGFSDGEEPASGWSVRNRVKFADAWKPVADRLETSQLDLECSRIQAREFFQRFIDDYEELDLYSIFSWVVWDRTRKGQRGAVRGQSERHRLRMGWPILFEGLRRGQLVLSAGEFSGLDLNLETLLRQRAGGDDKDLEEWQPLEILPSRLWTLILLVDAIDRCPWSVFSVRLGWHLPTYFVLTGALMHAAYLHALKTAGFLAESDLADPQRKIVDGLERRDASWILLGDARQDRYEENVFARLSDVLSCELPETVDNPLSQAASRFFELAPYRAVRELAAEGLYF